VGPKPDLRAHLIGIADPRRSPSIRRMVSSMWTVLLILLVAWVVLSIVGFVFEGLLWLGIIGIVLFVGTLIFGILRQRAKRAKA
jgi:fatty acid desaturase